MRDLIISIFGTYTPNTFIDENGVERIASGLAGVDWLYVGGLMVFCICLYSVFRIIGSIFNK